MTYEQLEALKEVAKLPCHRCGTSDFIFIAGFMPFPVYETKEELQTGRPARSAVPAVGVACSRCGALTFHATKRLAHPSEAKG